MNLTKKQDWLRYELQFKHSKNEACSYLSKKMKMKLVVPVQGMFFQLSIEGIEAYLARKRFMFSSKYFKFNPV
jgi:hypothetical protein